MPEFKSLEGFAEYVRRTAGRQSAELLRALGPEHPATEKAVEMCSAAAEIVCRMEMEREQAEVDNLDLSALPAPSKELE